jgi:transglutaminase-like putative cysteine protease
MHPPYDLPTGDAAAVGSRSVPSHQPGEDHVTRCDVSTSVVWEAQDSASAIVLVRLADADGQERLDEVLEVDGADVEDLGVRPDGARPVRLHAGAGEVSLRYRASVELAQDDAVPTDVTLPRLGGVGVDLLTWTLPSRYCPSDVLTPAANAMFGDRPRTGALLEEVRSWVASAIAYVPGTSDAHTAADETFLRRTGVCRDLAHLTATLLRALDVPARLVSAYALDLDPQDLHAVVEAHDGTAWRLLDATGLAPTGTLGRIATGRDAAEIAWATQDGPLTLRDLAVDVTRS